MSMANKMVFASVWALVKTITLVSVIWMPISSSQVNREGYFVRVNLAGYQIKSPLKTVQVQTVHECIMVCLNTAGCTTVAMFSGSCQPCNGEVHEVNEHLYSQAYQNKDLTVSCLDELILDTDVEILKIYPYLHGHVTLTCSHGYLPNETTMETGSTCEWTGSQPTCLKSHQLGNNLYVFITGRHDWSESYNSCKSLGGRLTDIQSAGEDDFISATIVQYSYTDSFWIGGYRVDSANFIWIDINQTVGNIRWGPVDPNNYEGAEDCILLVRQPELYMVDQNCGERYGYICKIPPVE